VNLAVARSIQDALTQANAALDDLGSEPPKEDAQARVDYLHRCSLAFRIPCALIRHKRFQGPLDAAPHVYMTVMRMRSKHPTRVPKFGSCWVSVKDTYNLFLDEGMVFTHADTAQDIYDNWQHAVETVLRQTQERLEQAQQLMKDST
jgi:hypothetical protein